MSVKFSRVVDVLGGLLADIADVKVEAEAAKAVLIGMAAQDSTCRAFEGDMFRAVVSFGDKRVTDYKAIFAVLVRDGFINQDLLDHLLKTHTSVAEGVPSVRCTARKGV